MSIFRVELSPRNSRRVVFVNESAVGRQHKVLLRHIIADDDTVGIQRILVAGRGQVVDLFDVAQLDPATRVKGKIQGNIMPLKVKHHQQLSRRIGAAPGERTPDRTNQRNGHRPKLLSTPAGDVELEPEGAAELLDIYLPG